MTLFKTAKQKIEKAFGLSDFAPLAEILQIRREFEAASEIFLIEDIRALGAELVDPNSYETFRAEALALLFRDEYATERDGDPVDLRFSIAREEARVAFGAHVEETIAAELEKGRGTDASRDHRLACELRAVGCIRSYSRRPQYIEGCRCDRPNICPVGRLKGPYDGRYVELRKARGDLPSQFAATFSSAPAALPGKAVMA